MFSYLFRFKTDVKIIIKYNMMLKEFRSLKLVEFIGTYRNQQKLLIFIWNIFISFNFKGIKNIFHRVHACMHAQNVYCFERTEQAN